MSFFFKLFNKKKKSFAQPTAEIVLNSSEFNINAMLDDVTNAIMSKSDTKNVNLLFEADKTVPSKIIGDRLLIGEVLIALLDYVIALDITGDIRLTVQRLKVRRKELRLKFKIIYIDSRSNQASSVDKLNDFFDHKFSSLINIENRSLFTSRNILKKMGATFEALKEKNEIVFAIEVTLQAKNLDERRHYRLPSRDAIGLNVLILDEEFSATEALKQKLEYFQHNVVSSSKMFYKNNEVPNFSKYDIIFISDKVYSTDIGKQILETRKKSNIKFVLVENMFHASKNDREALQIADSLMFKPVNQQTVFDLLINLYGDDRQDLLESNLDDQDQKVQKVHQVFVAKAGLERAGNNSAMFNEVLREFLIKYSNVGAMVNNLLKAKRLDAIQTYLFDLKGVLANIGAYRLSHHIELLEHSIIEEDTEKISKNIMIFKQEFFDVSKAIENFMLHID